MSTRFRLHIPQAIFDAMLDQARDELPNECCGFLAGMIAEGIGAVVERFPLVNVLQSPVVFDADPRSLFAAHKAMRAKEIDVLAVYHSHPRSEPMPSRTDRERNYSESVVNLIIGLKHLEADVRGWWLTATSFEPATFEVKKVKNSPRIDTEEHGKKTKD
jgi:proteasome lid subunit RPN8/RPN11